jgi:hypothetical protein
MPAVTGHALERLYEARRRLQRARRPSQIVELENVAEAVDDAIHSLEASVTKS